MRNSILLVLAIHIANIGHGQRDSVIVLDEAILTDHKLHLFSDGNNIRVLSDSILFRNMGMLTDNLKNNTHIYFKQNGYGMVSSAAFRGTSAQQTAVVWNGININSQLTGQTDFNTILAQSNSKIQIRSGGGSTQYGTGAIGGSIHIGQQLNFTKHFENSLQLGYGSFDTWRTNVKTEWGSEKTSFHLALSHVNSDNDFKYLGANRQNENGGFSNQNIDLAFGSLISKSQVLKLYHNTFFGNRDFSGTLTAPSDDNYRDFNSRSLVEWVTFKKGFVQRVKAAYLFERYRYFPNKALDAFSFGKSGNVLLNYDYLKRFDRFKVNGIVQGNVIRAKSSSILSEERRRLFGTVLVSYQPSKKISYALNFRKDWVSDFDGPLVYAFDLKYTPVQTYSVIVNASRNFRIPTFNDLYWEGAAALGNIDLQPETSLQGDLGQTLILQNFSLTMTGYYIDTADLIQWRPDLSDNWSPTNIKDVTQYGLEVETVWKEKIGKHGLHWRNGYAFTKSLDDETQKQLIYVPLHRLTSNLTYSFGKWSSFVQGLYNGEVFTTTDNTQNLPDYIVVDYGISYRFSEINGVFMSLQLIVNNLFNKNYQNVAFRPMPNSNIHLNLNLKL